MNHIRIIQITSELNGDLSFTVEATVVSSYDEGKRLVSVIERRISDIGLQDNISLDNRNFFTCIVAPYINSPHHPFHLRRTGQVYCFTVDDTDEYHAATIVADLIQDAILEITGGTEHE